MILLPRSSWEIKTTQKKGRGVFAKKNITAGTVIGDYIGKVIKTAEEDTVETDEGLYLMYYHDYASLYPIDVHAPGIHLLNHSCDPNCWMYTYKGHTLFFSLRHIFAGEELTASYLLSPQENCNHCPHVCRCESPFCTHTMHLSQERFDQWNEFNEKETKKTKRARIRYGKELPRLSSYPETISDNAIYPLLGSLEKEPIIDTNKKLPSRKELRKRIRDTGRTIAFPFLKTIVLGIKNDEIISKPYERTSSQAG